MICPLCGKKAIHLGDHDSEDYMLEEEGIVSNAVCPDEKCEVDTIIIYRLHEKENNKKT